MQRTVEFLGQCICRPFLLPRCCLLSVSELHSRLGAGAAQSEIIWASESFKTPLGLKMLWETAKGGCTKCHALLEVTSRALGRAQPCMHVTSQSEVRLHTKPAGIAHSSRMADKLLEKDFLIH